jgi:hypothetical protein
MAEVYKNKVLVKSSGNSSAIRDPQLVETLAERIEATSNG